MDKYTKLGN